MITSVKIECQDCGEISSFCYDDMVDIDSTWRDGERCIGCDQHAEQVVINCRRLHD